MKRLNFILAFTLTALFSFSYAQIDDTGITVTGSGTVYGEPDIAVLDLGVDILNEDLAAAIDEVNQTVGQVRQTLTEAGVAERDIRTAYLSVYREERYDNPDAAPRYRVSNTLNVTVRDVAQAGSLLAAGLEAGANTVGGIRYTFENPTALESQARDLAVQAAREKAEQFAQLASVALGPVATVSDASVPTSFAPRTVAASFEADAASSVPVSGGELSVSATVRMRFIIYPENLDTP